MNPVYLDDMEIVTAVISMASNLNLHVIAEGVGGCHTAFSSWIFYGDALSIWNK